ncbi:MAG: hypothetical protein JJT76_00575 [Clostridiaceae bacterium]|nr:hypothetical protein [Clostridiaceae bacterium]
MANHKFYGMQDTGNNSLQGEKIYQEYGSTKHYKEDYLGQKVECDSNGNVIHSGYDQNNTSYSDHSGGSASIGMGIIGFVFIGIAVTSFDGIIIMARESFYLIKWSILSTLLISILNYLNRKNTKAGGLDIILLVAYLLNRTIATMAGYSIFYYLLTNFLSSSDISWILEIILFIFSFFVIKYLQTMFWEFFKKVLH